MKKRIDKLLVDKGLEASRTRARALIMAGDVLVDEIAVTKAGEMVESDCNIRIREMNRFVSRGGLKLDGALNDLGFDVSGLTILDIGSSTGGFTDCSLQRGASRIFAVDVGTNQLSYSLRKDPRVTSFENTNAKSIVPEMFETEADIALIDVSFISITSILEPVAGCVRNTGKVVAMVKPQFEVGREKVGKGGVVKNDEDRREAVNKVIRYAQSIGFNCIGSCDSRVAGPKGNREIFVLFEKGDS